jgi:calcineurin-like phosphoesterase family protein
MPNEFLVSDTHFGHNNICKFLDNQGNKVRPWDTAQEMDEEMIKRWNSVVKPGDKVYHLGDVVINRKALNTLYRLNGDKVLIKGNHDIFKLQDYTEHFRDIRAYHVMNGCILSHVPVHVDTLARFGANIHGHLHQNRVLDKSGKIDPRYLNVSVEQINYTPISLEEAFELIKAQGGQVGFKTRGC